MDRASTCCTIFGIGNTAFSVAALQAWNKLPTELKLL